MFILCVCCVCPGVGGRLLGVAMEVIYLYTFLIFLIDQNYSQEIGSLIRVKMLMIGTNCVSSLKAFAI